MSAAENSVEPSAESKEALMAALGSLRIAVRVMSPTETVVDPLKAAIDAWVTAGPETEAAAEATVAAVLGRPPALFGAGVRLVLQSIARRDARIDELRNEVADREDELARLKAKVARLRKMLDDAGQGEHNERAAAPKVESVLRLRPLGEWHEDFAVGLFWAAPVDQPPYVGAPDDDGWPFDSAETIVWIPCPDPLTDGSEFVPAKVVGGAS